MPTSQRPGTSADIASARMQANMAANKMAEQYKASGGIKAPGNTATQTAMKEAQMQSNMAAARTNTSLQSAARRKRLSNMGRT